MNFNLRSPVGDMCEKYCAITVERNTIKFARNTNTFARNNNN